MLNLSVVFTLLLTQILTLNVGQLIGQSISNPCRFNEFRCDDGSGCLKAEKLCDTVEDCANGEDENGNEKWDCSRSTLSSRCGHNQFKCRLGDCIASKQKCDGIAQCWGGTDESIELCGGRPGPTAGPRPTASMQGTTRKPRPIPTTQASTMAATRPTTQRVISVSTTEPQAASTQKSCPPLTEPEGTRINCLSQISRIQCKNKNSPEGTVAIYSCKPFWSPPQTGSKTTRRTCKNGSWSSLNRNYHCYLDCGKDGKPASGFIVGGETSSVGQWPWHVALYGQDPPGSGKYVYFCGASLISKRALLTAAHCITKPQTTEIKGGTIIAVLGKYNRTFNNDDNQIQKLNVIDIDVDEYYNPNIYENDIAIIWPEKDVEITERVRPVCLPDGEDNVEAGQIGTLVGFGRWFDRGYPEQLQQVRLPIVRPSVCKETHPSLETLSRSTTFCAGYRNGTSACDGDSGGGYILEEKGKWYIQGVVSAGISHRLGGCDPNYFTVFTKVDKYNEWISSLLDRKDNLQKSKQLLT